MHVYMMTRGIKNCVDNFINDLQAQYFPYAPGKLKDGSDNLNAQLHVRPIQLWEIAVSKQHLPVLCKTLFGDSLDVNEKINPILWSLRHALKAKKFPEMDLKNTPHRLIRNQFVATYPIGIKEDEVWPKGHKWEGLERL